MLDKLRGAAKQQAAARGDFESAYTLRVGIWLAQAAGTAAHAKQHAQFWQYGIHPADSGFPCNEQNVSKMQNI
jgi:hypothetical protein